MLSDLQPSVQSYADVISRVTGIDVEIVDSNMVRVAGTGIYADSVGQNLARAGEVYKEVMRSRKTIQVDTPRHHPICERCPDREKCREHFSLSTPIADEDRLFGVIGLVCFNDEDRTRMLSSLES